MLTAVTITRLEEAATDNGFDLNLERTADWLSFDNTQTPMPIWLGAMDESQFVAAPIAGRRPGRVGGRWCGVHPTQSRVELPAHGASATSPHCIAC